MSKVGLALFLVSFVAILAIASVLTLSLAYAERSEKRILFAVVVSLPFLLVRLVYAALFTFGNRADFSPLRGSVTLLLCVALLEEMAIVLVYEGAGLTLAKAETRRDGGRG